MSNIDKIRQEIERQMKFYDEKEMKAWDDSEQGDEDALWYQGHRKMCAKLLSFIDSLPDEPVTTCNELEEAIKPDFAGCVLDSTKFALLGNAAGKSLLEPHIETMRRRIERKIAELPPAPEGYRYAWKVENFIKEGDAFTVTSNIVLKQINPEHDEQH